MVERPEALVQAIAVDHIQAASTSLLAASDNMR